MTSGAVQRPVGYRLVVPDGWRRIEAGEEHRERHVARLVAEQFSGVDHLPHVRRRLQDSLLAYVARAWEDGAVELYLSVLRAGPLPLSSSLVVSYLPGPERGTLEEQDHQQMLLSAAREERADRQVTDVRLLTSPEGWAVRRLVDREAPAGGDALGQALGPNPTFGVDWFHPVPGSSGATLLLSFSSPLLPLRADLTALFDTVATTLAWT